MKNNLLDTSNGARSIAAAPDVDADGGGVVDTVAVRIRVAQRFVPHRAMLSTSTLHSGETGREAICHFANVRWGGIPRAQRRGMDAVARIRRRK